MDFRLLKLLERAKTLDPIYPEDEAPEGVAPVGEYPEELAQLARLVEVLCDEHNDIIASLVADHEAGRAHNKEMLKTAAESKDLIELLSRFMHVEEGIHFGAYSSGCEIVVGKDRKAYLVPRSTPPMQVIAIGSRPTSQPPSLADINIPLEKMH